MLLLALACTSTSVPLGTKDAEDDTAGEADTDDTTDTDTAAPPTYAGTGADGPLVTDGPFDLSALAPSWPVTGMEGDTVGVVGEVTGLAEGDEVLLLDLHGSDDAYADVGRYAFARVASVVGASVRLVSSHRAGPSSAVIVSPRIAHAVGRTK